MNILVCNAGSTSLKFKLYSYPDREVQALCRIERVGCSGFSLYSFVAGEVSISDERASVPNYKAGVERFLGDLSSNVCEISEISTVGFKTVLSKGHYGVHFIDNDVIAGMEDFLSVAPAHNRAYIDVINVFRDIMPDTPLVGSFETAFHATIPIERRVYGIPYELTEKYGIYKMGYHGASHSYVASMLSDYRRVISCHLGGSGSICAILNGKSVDNSFGFSLQAGVQNASRAGDIDSFIIPFLVDRGMTFSEVIETLEKRGGLAGISGTSGDMRDIRAAIAGGDNRAKLAVDVYVNGIVKYIGAYFMELGGLDAIAFTGGIGERDSALRAQVLSQIAHIGVDIDPNKNAGNEFTISTDNSKVKAFVIPANEEQGVADNTARLIGGRA